MKLHSFKVEDNTINGSGVDEIGEFEINGNIDGDDVKFMKQYKNMHPVEYQGKFNDEKTVIEGNWYLGLDLTDKFKIWVINKVFIVV